jgi:hypothetical protein
MANKAKVGLRIVFDGEKVTADTVWCGSFAPRTPPLPLGTRPDLLEKADSMARHLLGAEPGYLVRTAHNAFQLYTYEVPRDDGTTARV